MPLAFTRRMLLLPLALALLVAACSGGDDDGDSAPAGQDYESRLRALVQEVTDDLDVARARLDDAESLQELVDAIVEAAPLIVDVIREGADRLDDLDPPARFADDHRRFIQAVREQIEVFEALEEAAEDGDLGALGELGPRADSITERLEAAISPEFRALIAPFFGESGGTEDTVLPEDAESGSAAPPAREPENRDADDAVGGNPPEADEEPREDVGADDDLTAYEAELYTIVAEVEASLDAASAEFEEDVLAAVAGVDPQDEQAVFEALVDVVNDFLPTVFALINDGVNRLEALDPPPAYAEEHALFLDAVRALADVPLDSLSDAEDIGALQALIADLAIQQDQIEASLRSGISPEFFALIEPFFDDDSSSSSGEGASDDSGVADIESGETSFEILSDLPEGFPDALVPAGGELESASELESDGEVFTQATFVVTGDADALLDAYQAAFDDLGLTGARSRFAAADFYTLDASGTGAIRHGTVLISPATVEGEWSVTVSLMAD